MHQEEALAYSVPEKGYPGWEAGAPAMLAAAAASLPDLAVLELTFFATSAIAAVATLLGALQVDGRQKMCTYVARVIAC